MNHPKFAQEPDINAIPEGPYCYGPNGRACPYWAKIPDRPYQENGYCDLLGKGDWELGPTEGLLWDMVKSCQIKDGD